MTKFNVLDLPNFADSRGVLTVIDGLLPFPVNRLYWIHGVQGQVRGGHRHHKTRQGLIAISGCVSIYLNDGTCNETILLDSPHRCLVVEPKDWHTMTFSDNSVLLVISSHPYDVNDYIDEAYE